MPGDLIAPRILGGSSSRSRAGIISGKFQTGNRGLASAAAAGKSVNVVGGSFEKDSASLPLGMDRTPLARRGAGTSGRVGCGNWLPAFFPEQPQTEISSELPISRKECTTFPVSGARGWFADGVLSLELERFLSNLHIVPACIPDSCFSSKRRKHLHFEDLRFNSRIYFDIS